MSITVIKGEAKMQSNVKKYTVLAAKALITLAFIATARMIGNIQNRFDGKQHFFR